MLPKDFPAWQTVYWWFRRLMRRFLFQTIHDIDVLGEVNSNGDNRHGLPLLLVLMKAETSSWHVDADSRLPQQPRDGEVPFIL